MCLRSPGWSAWPLATMLPRDVVRLIAHHAHASAIQRRFRVWTLYGHARSRAWARVRLLLGARTVRELWPFSVVRREWRQEPESWLAIDVDANRILHECASGLWGPAARVSCGAAPAALMEPPSRSPPGS